MQEDRFSSRIRHLLTIFPCTIVTVLTFPCVHYNSVLITIPILQVIALAALVAVALARPQNGYGVPTPSSAPAKYDFNYAVNDPPSGNDFGHQEARDGPNTQGSYYVLLPDGRLQKVAYTVNGDSGYVADVTYEGEASTPRPYTPAPQYG
ncbi:pro-resilin-like [Penaeus vannamei]|uniref:pro-resilin-like n=1 Tax=Penaeus vannamei TaxID=6689 RepID=UPI00387F4F8E